MKTTALLLTVLRVNCFKVKINSHVDPNCCYIFYRDAFSEKNNVILKVSVSAVSNCGNWVEIKYRDKTGKLWWSSGLSAKGINRGLDVRLLMTFDQAEKFDGPEMLPQVGDIVLIHTAESAQIYTSKSGTGVITKKFEEDDQFEVFLNEEMQTVKATRNKFMILSKNGETNQNESND